MVQAALNPLSFEDYLDLYPEDGGCYELKDGEIVQVRPRGPHEKIGGFIAEELTVEKRRLKLPYFVPRSCSVKPPRPNTGHLPDVILLDETKVDADPYWIKASSVSTPEPIILVVETVSTNWRDDYGYKFNDYEALGVPEYWIVDYLGLGAARVLDGRKEPTISVCELVGGEYRVKRYRRGDAVMSPAFPELTLPVDQVFAAAEGKP